MVENDVKKSEKLKEFMNKDLNNEADKPWPLTAIYGFAMLVFPLTIVMNTLKGQEISLFYVGAVVLICLLSLFNIGMAWKRYINYQKQSSTTENT